MPNDELIQSAILRHVGLYRLTLEPVVRRLFFEDASEPKGKAPALAALEGLVAEGLLRPHLKKNHQAFDDEVGFWTITILGTKQANVPRGRGKPSQAQAIATHLRTLWFCCLAAKRRHRLEPEDLKNLFGDSAPHANIPHCIAEEEDGPRIYRVFTPETNPSEAIEQVIATLDEIFATNRSVQDWIDARDYAVAILGETEEKCADLQHRVRKSIDGQAPLYERCHCVVELGPSPTTIKMALDKRRPLRPTHQRRTARWTIGVEPNEDPRQHQSRVANRGSDARFAGRHQRNP